MVGVGFEPTLRWAAGRPPGARNSGQSPKRNPSTDQMSGGARRSPQAGLKEEGVTPYSKESNTYY